MSANQLPKGQSRRTFIRNASFAASFFIIPRHVLGRGFIAPSDKINLGFIGCGKQSGGLAGDFLRLPNVQVTAAADVFSQKMQRFVQRVNKHYADAASQPAYSGCKSYADFREMLDDKTIDAVAIVTPDHWHAAMAVRACAARKDVYCEKPLSLTVAEGRAMVKAARRYKRVFQTGSMQRSWKEFRHAVELVQNGYIGNITAVEVNIGPPVQPFDLPAQPIPNGLDWQAWLGPNTVERPYHQDLAPDLEYEAKIWPYWRKYTDFGGGMVTDWGAHMFDIAQWGLGMDESGPVELLPPAPGEKGGLVLTYANGVKMTHRLQTSGTSPYTRFIGDKGEITVQRGKLTTTPETLKDVVIKDTEKRVYYSDNHYADFINCIATRNRPICDVEVGHRSASVGNLANIAYQRGTPLQWNPAKEKFENDDMANGMLTRPLKKEWRIKGV